MSLEARSLTFRYPRRGKKPVLEHVNLTLEPGERVGLTAPSGRGKTTLCKLLAGVRAAHGGGDPPGVERCVPLPIPGGPARSR